MRLFPKAQLLECGVNCNIFKKWYNKKMSIDLLKKTTKEYEANENKNEKHRNLPAGRQERWPHVLFFIIFGLLIFGSVAFTYYRIVMKRDYTISAEAECDPYLEKCFIYVCDPTAEECTGDPEEDTSYYKIMKRKAFNIPLCDPNIDETCEALICSEGEVDCSYELCEEENADGIECVDPEQYAIDNPPEEEEEGCAEDDEECLSEEESECEEGDEECLSEEESDSEEDSSIDEAECDAETEDCSADSSEEPSASSRE